MDAVLALLPAALLALVFRYREILPSGAVWLAAALAVSTFGDLWATAMGGAWWPSYLWLPVQLGLAVFAVSRRKEWIGVCAWLLVFGLFNLTVTTGPDLLVTAAGSVALTAMVLRSGHPLATPVLIYFGLGSATYFGMVAAFNGGPFMVWWYMYQACRVLGWVALANIVRVHWWERRVERASEAHMLRVSLLYQQGVIR